MNRQEISAFLANCEVSEMMGFCDLGDSGCVVIAPDGRKCRYTNDQLDQAEQLLLVEVAVFVIQNHAVEIRMSVDHRDFG